MHNTVIYSAIFGGYDRLAPPRCSISGCDLVCFTDNRAVASDVWDVRYVDVDGETSALANRRYKMLPHVYLADYAQSLYIDGNVRILRSPEQLIRQVLGEGSIGITSHPERDCVFDELQACIEYGKISREESLRWLDFYQRSGMRRHAGLFENNVIVRRHNDPAVVQLMQVWWEFYRKFGGRDQLSLVALASAQGVNIQSISTGPRYSRKYFSLTAHEVDRQKGPLSFIRSHINANRHVNVLYGALAKLILLVDRLRSYLKKA